MCTKKAAQAKVIMKIFNDFIYDGSDLSPKIHASGFLLWCENWHIITLFFTHQFKIPGKRRSNGIMKLVHCTQSCCQYEPCRMIDKNMKTYIFRHWCKKGIKDQHNSDVLTWSGIFVFDIKMNIITGIHIWSHGKLCSVEYKSTNSLWSVVCHHHMCISDYHDDLKTLNLNKIHASRLANNILHLYLPFLVFITGISRMHTNLWLQLLHFSLKIKPICYTHVMHYQGVGCKASICWFLD